MECEKNCHLVTNLSDSPLPLHIPPISIQGLGQVDCLEYNQDEKEREGEPMWGGWRNEGTTDQTKETIASGNLPRGDPRITFVDHMIRLRGIEE